DNTRHNAGFAYVDALAERHHGQWKADKKYAGELCQINMDGRAVMLLKPMTFMNCSGQSVAALAQFFKWPPDGILVAHDELDLNPGIARFKQGGGHGGHNGLRDIIACLGNQKQFYRLRIGIGHPGQARDVVNFVLSKAPPAERELTDNAINAALAETALAANGHWAKAQNALHSFRG
ncbi:MAG: aminoacyl-tRNA hydrolase, partial [Natronospirillum sp.]